MMCLSPLALNQNASRVTAHSQGVSYNTQGYRMCVISSTLFYIAALSQVDGWR